MPRGVWVTLALVWVMVGVAVPPTTAAAQPPLGPLEPVGPPSSSSALPFDPLPPGTEPSPPAARRSAGHPPPVLGAPVGPARPAPAATPVAPAGFSDPPPERNPQRAAKLGAPAATKPVPATEVDAALARTAYTPPPTDPVAEFLNQRSDLGGRADREQPPGGTGLPKSDSGKFSDWGEKLDGMFGGHHGGWFRSDHLFDGFISPVSNPFLFEDPRSLTEVRPIFIYQKVPSRQADFDGGNVSFFGTQARLAITERWSFVFHKLGGISVNPSGSSGFADDVSFAELWLGPKYTFYRGEETCSLAAAGLQFQLPVGSRDAFQDTGSLSLVPYVTYAQNFLRDFRPGSLNGMVATGYSFSTTRARSDYYWLSGHLDFDVANLHRFYPLAELNWFLYSTNGNTTPIGAEGRDLINFGGQAKGTGLLTMALGGRAKLTEHAQFGAAFEFPVAGRRDIFRNRFTVDFILRY